MKYLFFSLFSSLAFLTCKDEGKKSFTPEALATQVVSIDESIITLKQVFEQAKGKTTLVDIWASWCPDCIKGMPTIQGIQAQYGDKINYVFLSLDKDENRWKAAIDKYKLRGNHYWLKGVEDWKKNPFTKSIGLDWIPRYMVISKDGSIKVFYAKQADDTAITQTLAE